VGSAAAEFAEINRLRIARAVGMEDHLAAYWPRYMHIRQAIRTHLPEPRGPALDVGCGYGVALWLLRNLGFTELIGVDLFTKKDQSLLADIAHARYLRGNLEDVNALATIASDSCACVISSQVLEHLFNHPFHHLEECYRVLRPGGLALLDIPNPCTLANAWRMLRGRFDTWGDAEFASLPKVKPDGSLATTWSIHYREYPPPVLEQLVRRLPGCRVLGKGFLATAPAPSASFPKRLVKHALRLCGIANRRLFANVQWLAFTKTPPCEST
jgi:SAM-dependent methyltransferase